MCQKADPLVSGTVRKLVDKEIHLLCLLYTLRDGPVMVARSKPQRSILAYFIYLFILELGHM